MRELGVVCHACFCTFYTSEMNTHSYMPFLFSINFLCHLYTMVAFLVAEQLHADLKTTTGHWPFLSK